MLGTHRLTSNRADYYLADLAQELPAPLVSSPAQAVWMGRAAEGLGLAGAVDPDQFRAVLDGRHPVVLDQMRSNRATVLGYDLTFSAPKSASVLYALGGEDVARHIVEAHAEAVGGAVSYLERHGVTATRGSGPWRQVIPTTGMVAASFTHGVSRNGDPHLHSHVVMANLVHGDDGRWSACDQRGITAHRAAASEIYDAHLRLGMAERLGVEWTQAPLTTAEVAGISPLLVAEFSTRSADIRIHMAERRVHSARANQVAWAVTRPPKGEGAPYAHLVEDWQRRAAATGVDRAELSAVLGHDRDRHDRPAERPACNEHQFAAALSVTPHGGAYRRDVVGAFASAAANGARASTIEALADTWVPGGGPSEVGVVERVQQRRSVVPAPYLLRTLGPRPLDLSDHQVWRQAAQGIEAYRDRWGITAKADALGVDQLSNGLASLPTRQLIDHLRTTEQVEMARTRLGRREPLVLELDHGRDRGLGR
jgi:conjugative relaxase-like TrwC/TraI family protein